MTLDEPRQSQPGSYLNSRKAFHSSSLQKSGRSRQMAARPPPLIGPGMILLCPVRPATCAQLY